MERKPLIVANWKMYLSAKESILVAQSFVKMLRDEPVDIIISPSYPLLSAMKEICEGTSVEVAAQDIHFLESGAYTGDVSVGEVKDFVRHVIVGHSERRKYHGDTDEIVALKTKLALKNGIHPIVCVGESFEEHESGATIEIIREQVNRVLVDLSLLDFPRITFAYEPVWAISAGPGLEAKQPEAQEVAEIINLIRKIISGAGGNKYMDKMRVLYGGSVTAKTVKTFVSEPGVDGALVGGASTKPAELVAIIREVALLV
jgi:triosephosphate isomerase